MSFTLGPPCQVSLFMGANCNNDRENKIQFDWHYCWWYHSKDLVNNHDILMMTTCVFVCAIHYDVIHHSTILVVKKKKILMNFFSTVVHITIKIRFHSFSLFCMNLSLLTVVMDDWEKKLTKSKAKLCLKI